MGCRQAVRHQTLTLTCVGSNPAIPAKYDPLAQSVEQLPFKQWVWSSNLQRVTKKEISPRGYLFFDTRGDSKIGSSDGTGKSCEREIFRPIEASKVEEYYMYFPLLMLMSGRKRSAHSRSRFHQSFLIWNSPVDCSLASARRCQLLTRCLSTGAANLSGSLRTKGSCLVKCPYGST